MNYLSLFSGIGGLDLGLDRAGMTCVGQVEIDPFCRRVLAKHWPEVPRHDDVHTAVEWWLGESRPAVDVVCGGFPCQPVSQAGRRLAQGDARWQWPAMWTVIRNLRPSFAIVENVPGLLSRGLGDVLGDLAAGGYDAEWDCVPASALSAHHRRDRVFVVAYPHSEPGGALVSSLAEHRREEVRAGATESRRCGSDVANTTGQRWGTGGSWRSDGGGQDGQGIPTTRLAWVGPRLARDSSGWAPEPDVGRVAYGVPGRVDRLRALGNAVVPQVAEHIGRMVMAVAA